ncbi:protein seele [Agrilus planipennis]|uniref:Protein seele n=1 Tax=Agrilus planipennis TaxID=224129 RepID=A0A1W4WK81_AGRPL|nr:protein seele [Agrilus planipennis]
MFFHIVFLISIINSLVIKIKSNSYGPEGEYSIINEDVIGNEVKCLVCKASIKELNDKLKKVDPSKTEDVGGYKFDSAGNLQKKTIPQMQSEIFISDMIEEICGTMENYVRARWKSNGQLTLLKMFDSSGNMNSDITEVDLIQDEDLNKSLEFYCKSVFEEYEENVINHIKEGTKDVIKQVCSVESKLCKDNNDSDSKLNKEEL